MHEVIDKIIGYLTFRKDKAEGSFVKSMHFINKLTLFIFLVAMIILVMKLRG